MLHNTCCALCYQSRPEPLLFATGSLLPSFRLVLWQLLRLPLTHPGSCCFARKERYKLTLWVFSSWRPWYFVYSVPDIMAFSSLILPVEITWQNFSAGHIKQMQTVSFNPPHSSRCNCACFSLSSDSRKQIIPVKERFIQWISGPRFCFYIRIHDPLSALIKCKISFSS